MTNIQEGRKEKFTNNEIYDLIINIRNIKPEIRKLSIDSIPDVFKYLGTERAISEFLPFVLNNTQFTESEWTNVLKSFKLIHFEDFQFPEITRFFEQIKFLSEIDSKIVRYSFVDLIHTFYELTIDGIQELITNYVNELLKADWEPSQMTGLLVLPKIFDQLSSSAKNELLDSLIPLHESENTNVRILYIQICSKIIHSLGESETGQILQTIQPFIEDPSQYVINEVPNCLVNYSQAVSNVDEIIDPLSALIQNSNWLIRFSTIYSMKSLFENVTVQFEDFYPFLEIASHDSENEIRIVVCEQLPLVLKMKDIDTSKLQELIDTLIKDPNHHCRTSLASSLPLFSNCLGYEFVTSHLLDLIPDSSREVKLAAIDSLKSKEITRVTALECILTLIKSKHQYLWREKQNIVEIIPSFIDTKSENVQDLPHFIELIRLLLNDGADNVRMEMVRILPLLRKQLGDEWFQKQIYPILEAASTDDDYQIRMTAVKAIIKCQIYNDFGMKIITKAAQDKVSNVRLVVAKYLPRNYKNILEKLQNDSDPDVSELAQKS